MVEVWFPEHGDPEHKKNERQDLRRDFIENINPPNDLRRERLTSETPGKVLGVPEIIWQPPIAEHVSAAVIKVSNPEEAE